jgi:ActR/RegA family two-component response regulator
LVIHGDDAFRKALIAALDQHHFTVTFTADEDRAVDLVRNGKFRVALLGLSLSTRAGLHVLEPLREAREQRRLAVIVVGEPDPQLRTCAPWADETLLKPVDAVYVARRANAYCAKG